MVNLAAAAAHHLVPYVHTLDPTTPIDDACKWATAAALTDLEHRHAALDAQSRQVFLRVLRIAQQPAECQVSHDVSMMAIPRVGSQSRTAQLLCLPNTVCNTVCTVVCAAGVKHAGELLTVVASVLALCVWGFAVWWLVMAISCIAETVRQGIPFSLGWWGSGGYALNSMQRENCVVGRRVSVGAVPLAHCGSLHFIRCMFSSAAQHCRHVDAMSYR